MIYKLKRGGEILIDVEDLPTLDKWKWKLVTTPTGSVYVERETILNGVKKHIKLHRLLTNCPQGYIVDHKNRNPLDYRKDNLRIATYSQNQYNKKKSTRNTSGYKGVWKQGKHWAAYIGVNRTRHFLGYFPTPEEASLAYQKAVTKYHGEFAYQPHQDAP